MNGMAHDVRFALRMLVAKPMFTVVVVLTLGLGIGLNTAVFSIVSAILFKPLPASHPEELVGVYTLGKGGLFSHGPLSYPDYVDFRDGVAGLAGAVAYGAFPVALDMGEESEFVLADAVSCNYFSVLGINPLRGRTFTQQDDAGLATVPVAVLSYASWQHRFGGDPTVIGRTITINGTAVSVLGVAPSDFAGLQRGLAPEMWVPVQTTRALNGDKSYDRRDQRWLFVMGRLARGAALGQVAAEVEAVGRRLATEYPKTNRTARYGVLPASQIHVLPGLDRIVAATSFVLLALVGVVLAITGANVANVMLARGIARQREFSVRLATGASRWRLVRQLLVESATLGGLGCALGLGLAWLASRAVNSLTLPIPIQIRVGATLDWRVIAYSLAISAAAVLLFGLGPALSSARRDLAAGLRGGDRGGTSGPRRRRLQSALVVTQVTLSFVLLIAAGLALRSLGNAGSIDPGFDAEGLATATIATELRGYDAERAQRVVRDVLDRLAALPGTTSVSATSLVPLSFGVLTRKATPDRGTVPPVEEWPEIDSATVAPRYFETMKTPILLGRPIDATDSGPRPAHVVVNATMAHSLWPGEDPIGKRLRLAGVEGAAEVVGVAADGKYRTLGESARPFLYTSMFERNSGRAMLLVRTPGDPSALLPAIRREIRMVDGQVPILGLQTVAEATSTSLLVPRAGAALFGAFGVLGLLLASVGLYGVLSFTVGQRLREFGIRQALGADRGGVVRLVMRHGLVLASVGVLAGVALSVAGTRVLRAMLFGIAPTDPATFGTVTVLLIGVVLLACLGPARRATRVDLAAVLREE